VIESGRVVSLIQVRLYQMIIRSVFTVSSIPIMRCAFGAHLDVGLAERQTPCRFVGNLTFPPLVLEEDGRLSTLLQPPLNSNQ